jgi:hypothetical protein
MPAIQQQHVGIQEHQYVTLCSLAGFVARCAHRQPIARNDACAPLLSDSLRSIGRAVVGHQNLVIESTQCELVVDRIEQAWKISLFVEGWNDDRNSHDLVACQDQ